MLRGLSTMLEESSRKAAFSGCEPYKNPGILDRRRLKLGFDAPHRDMPLQRGPLSCSVVDCSGQEFLYDDSPSVVEAVQKETTLTCDVANATSRQVRRYSALIPPPVILELIRRQRFEVEWKCDSPALAVLQEVNLEGGGTDVVFKAAGDVRPAASGHTRGLKWAVPPKNGLMTPRGEVSDRFLLSCQASC